MSDRLGIIGGSGLTRLSALKIDKRQVMNTPYGEPSAPVTMGTFDGLPVVFLPRHGSGHTIPPHMINYRANVWAMEQLGVTRVVGMAAVGGISDSMAPGTICIPHQIIDYTSGRETTYYDGVGSDVQHIDFTEPYCAELRTVLIKAASAAGLHPAMSCTYAVTQGPRLETAQEIVRLRADGCDVVGMTAMPEAALARELDICYATCAVVVNWAAGIGEGPITMDEIEQNLGAGMDNARRIFSHIGGAS